VVGALALVSASCSDRGGSGRATDAGSRSSTSAPATTVPGAPAEYAAHPTDWVLPGHDYDNSRTARGAHLDLRNVGDLKVGWTANLTVGASTAPLIVGDTVYVQDGAGRISAFDRASGAVRWQTAPYGINIGPYGVAVADGRVFGMHGSKGVVAVDAATGRELWAHDIVPNATTGVDIQPTVFDRMVFASTVPVSIGGIYQGGDRGVIHALDAASGAERWQFDTVDSPDLWGNPIVNSGGGAWYPPSIDPTRGLVYFGTANPAPFPGTPDFPNGSSRPGDNLYSDSTVALDVHSGKLRWYHQAFPHDLFDRDMVHTMVARPRSGSHREVVVGTGKGGVLIGLDPSTGNRLWSREVGMHHNDDLTSLNGETTIIPGTFGGVLTPPATADGVAYAAVVNAPSQLRPDKPSYVGSDLGIADGNVVAVDASTGEVIWSTKVPGDPLGGATVVNDLVLTALLGGQLVALDRDTGKIVRTIDLPGGVNGWMAVSGDDVIVPVGNANPAQLVDLRLPR
jgi:alcohol dehydrogenase (cytochrome c)